MQTVEQSQRPKSEYIQLHLFNILKSGQNHMLEKREPHHQMMRGKLDVHIQKNKIRDVSRTLHKTNSKWIKDLYVKPGTVRTARRKPEQCPT